MTNSLFDIQWTIEFQPNNRVLIQSNLFPLRQKQADNHRSAHNSNAGQRSTATDAAPSIEIIPITDTGKNSDRHANTANPGGRANVPQRITAACAAFQRAFAVSFDFLVAGKI